MNNEDFSCYQESASVDSQHAPGGVVIYYADGDQEIIHVNQYVVDLYECDSVNEFLVLTGGNFKGLIHPYDIETVEKSIWAQVERRNSYDHTFFRISTKNGHIINVEEFGRLVEQEGSRPIFYTFVNKLNPSMTIDWLTGLPSMMRFHDLAKVGAEIIVSMGERPVAVALDLMGMKTYNAQYGRDAGDALLRMFGDTLRKYFGGEACSRFAEDHFYAFAPEDGLVERVESLFSEFSQMNEGRVLPVRAGAYVCDPEDDIVALGFDRAKIACDLDRKTWQSHLMWFTDEMKDAAQLRIHVLDQVDRAIKNKDIRPYYQAIVRTATGEVCGEEALARWIDPEYGFLSPAQFIPVLEEAGLLHKLDMHIVDCVLVDLAEKKKRHIPVVPVSVNISLRDLGQVNLTEELTRRADGAGVPRSLLRVEFTESAASENPEFFKAQLDSLRQAGFEVWMDDFGSGNSSLNMLREFDFDLIKLDMDFISGYESEKSKAIVKAIIQNALKMRMGILAEGVETKDQAVFLEDVGCDMLQGFFYSKPMPLNDVMDHFDEGIGYKREGLDEAAYWSAVGEFNLNDPAANTEGKGVDGSPLSEFPSGVMEYRDGIWSVVRANRSFREFLIASRVLSADCSHLQTNPIERDLGNEYAAAITRSKSSGSWERVSGRLEYGTGFQFYVRPIASTADAEAYAVATVPTMLGATLGTYGDIPVSYAVFRVILNEAGDEVIDMEYVYANQLYCDWGDYGVDDVVGRSFLEMNENASTKWFPYCYRAAVLGETIHEIVFAPESNHWFSMNVAPSPVDGCCIFAFSLADEEQRERDELALRSDTSELVIKIANVLSEEEDYDVAMNTALKMMSEVIHPERLYVFEWGEHSVNNTFEWCAEGISPEIDTLQDLDFSEFDTWAKLVENESVVLIPDIEVFKEIDERMHWQLERQGITRLLAVPFYSGDTLIGYLGADNYAFDESVDTREVLESVSMFMAARISSHNLISKLEWTNEHDVLTELMNRRGIDSAIAERMSEHAGEPFELALIDIDDFKTLNDQYGHDIGDEALKMLANLAEQTFPADAIVGRNSSDELLVMLAGDDISHTDRIFEDFSQNAMSFEHEGVTYRMSVSIGYVRYPDQAGSLASAFTAAAAALGVAKVSGRVGCVRYSG